MYGTSTQTSGEKSMGKMQANINENRKKTFLCIVLFVVGILLITILPSFWNNHVLTKQLQLQPGTQVYKFWMTPPQPLYIDIYFFNWTNPEHFYNKSIKPNFVEIGPYRFQEFPKKENVLFHDNSTVSYRKQSRYVFQPEQSKGRLDDLITSVNVVALSAANQARTWNIFKVTGVELSLAFYGQKLSLTKTADELLFKGYEDPIISVAREIAKIMGIDVPFDRFGWFYMRNESSLLTGDFNTNTGIDDITKLGQLRKWNFDSRTNFFEGTCGNLEGASAGELFPPHVSDDKNSISVFSPEMCRNVVMEYEEEVKVEGVSGVKYCGGKRTIDNGTKFAENACFCSGECVPSGVINVTSCRLGAPVFMSFPHFFDADDYYRDQIDGMSPNKDKHQFSMTLEPKTSLPLEIKGRFQLNVLMNPIKNINMYKNIPRKFLPVVWFEQHFKVDKDLALLINLAVNADLIGQIFGFLIALISLLWIFLIISRKDKRKIESHQEISTLKTIRLPESSPLIK